MLYTVDEVSDLLGVPRPTLYRYLKEYAIPYERHAGRITIPEGSVDRIRRVRELHDEGLGTAAVRRRLSEAEGSGMERITERLDRLAEEIEKSRSPEPIPSHQALNVVLARQTVLLSAVYDLTRMVEQLLERDGRPRSRTDIPLSSPPVTEPAGHLPPARVEGGRELEGAEPEYGEPARREPERPQPEVSPRRDRFGTLARRRRLTVGSLALLIAVLALLWSATTFAPGLL